MPIRVKFATQADPAVLAAVREQAMAEGRQFQAVVEEALVEWVDRKRGLTPRPAVIAHLKASIDRNRHLYQHLAE